MKKTILISLLPVAIVIAAFLYIHHNNRQIHDNLLLADKLMEEHPDSALHILQRIENPQNFQKENLALYALLLTQAKYKNEIPVENDSLIRFAEQYYQTSKDSTRKAWTYLYMAQVFRDMNEKKKALAYFQKAAIAAKNDENSRLSFLIYHHLGKLLQNQEPYEEGIQKLKKALGNAESRKDTSDIIYDLKDVGWSYVWKGDYKESRIYFEKGIKLAQTVQNNSMLSLLYHHLGMSFRMDNQLSKALLYTDKSLAYETDSINMLPTLSIKGDLFIKLNQLDSAKYYLEISKNDRDFYAIANYHNDMSNLEEKLGNYRKALEHRNAYCTYIDSIEHSERDQNLMDLQKKYNYSQVENDNHQLKIKNQTHKIITLIIVIALIISISIFFFLYNKVKNRKENIIRAKDTLLEQNVRQLQQRTNELLLSRQELQEKENNLRAYILKEKELQKDISGKENELQHYMQQQQELRDKIFKTNEVIQKIETIRIMDICKKINSKDELVLSKQEFDNMISAININFKNFAERLSKEYPLLTKGDIYICCLLKLKVPTQDILFLVGINESTLKKRKYRIKCEKMNLDKDDLSLEEYLYNY